MAKQSHQVGGGQTPTAEHSASDGGGGLWRRHSCRRVLATFQSPVPTCGKASEKSAFTGTRDWKVPGTRRQASRPCNSHSQIPVNRTHSRRIGVNPTPCLTTPEPSDARRSNRTLGGKSVFFRLRVYPHHHLGEASQPAQISRAQGFPSSILNHPCSLM